MGLKPICIDLFCGLGGWTGAFLAEGYDCIGFDIERHDYGTGGYPGRLVIQDALTLHGSQFRRASLIVASPPCLEYSYMAMPWRRGKQIAAALRGEGEFPDGYTGSRTIPELRALFDACFRIQREACEAAGRHIPMVVENVKGAQPWVGAAQANFGSFYLWGDIAQVGRRIVPTRPAFGQFLASPSRSAGKTRTNFHFHEETGLPSPSFHGAPHEASLQRAEAIKNTSGSWFNIAHNTDSGVGQNPVNGVKSPGMSSWSGHGDPDYKRQGFNVRNAQRFRDEHGTKQRGSGAEWFDKALDERRKAAGQAAKNGDSFGWSKDSPPRNNNSRSDSRKAASAQIAKIPYPLAEYIARLFKP